MARIASPLSFDGHTLSIPQASSTQDGYLSRDAFVLFSGGTLVPVTSFNTRTGEVVLLEDDVLAALGYVPLNKHGDTMTGPLLLPAGDPPSAQAATSKAYVDAHGGGASPGEYLVTSFGASGSALAFTGTILAGSLTTLTLTAASDFVVGQGILVGTSGSTGALVTKVDAIDATKKIITLHDAALSPLASVNVQHDDTVAIQTGINTAVVVGWKLLLPPGLYRCNKLTASPYWSALQIPQNPWGAPTQIFSISGITPPPFMNFQGPVSWVNGGAIIQSDLSGNENYCILSAQLLGPNNTTVFIENLTFRTYPNPQLGGIDLSQASFHVVIRNVCIDVGQDLLNAPWPTHGNFGIRFPANNRCTMATADNLEVQNYPIGIIMSEVLVSLNSSALRCAKGLQINIAAHVCTGRYLLWHNTINCEFTGGAGVYAGSAVDFVVDIEMDPAEGAGYDFSDPTNTARGRIAYIVNIAASGFGPPRLQGMDHVIMTDLGVASLDDLTVRGTLFLKDGVGTDQPVSFGTVDSGGTGFRHLIVPDV
jgi:hypothetical protein